MKKSKKLLSAFAAAIVLLFSFSVCVRAAQIDSLDVRDGVIDAYVTGLAEDDEAKLYAAGEENGSVVSVVNSCLISDGKAEGTIGIEDGRIYVWNAETLIPLMTAYDLIDGRAYAENSDICVPQSGVIVVAETDGKTLKGYEEGSEVEYSLAEDAEVVGMAEDISDVKPGSVVSPLFDREGRIVSLELLAALGGEGNDDDTLLKANCGERTAADGSVRYANVIGIYYSAALKSMTVRFEGDEFESGEETRKYTFDSSAKKSVVHMSDGAVQSVETSEDWSVIEKIDNSNAVYVYLRYDTKDNVVKEAVFYYFSEDTDITDDGEYSDEY